MCANAAEARRLPTKGQESFTYDAFVSYAHEDRPVAAGIQKGLHRIGRRMGRLHALRVFRDATDLTASPDLWGKVVEAMDRARYFIVVLSPHAVASGWVNKEVAHWLERRGPDQLLFVVAGGRLAWDEDTGRFDPDRSDVALPVLTEPGALAAEPFYVDVSEDAPWDPRAPMFREKVTDLAAPIHGKPKYELASEDLREQNRFRRLRRAAVAGLVLLTVIALAAATIAFDRQHEAQRQQREAERQRNQAIALRLVSDADAMLAGARARDDVRAIQQTLAAQLISPTPDPSALLRTLNAEATIDKIIKTGAALTHPTFASGPEAAEYNQTTSPDLSMAFSPDNRRVVTGGDELRMWDADSGERIDLPFQPNRGALRVAFSPDGHRIAAATMDNTIQIWDADNGQPIGQPLSGHTGIVYSVAFSPDGHHVAAGSADATIRLWDIDSGRTDGETLTGHDGAIYSVAFSPDGHRIVSGGNDATIRIWDVGSRSAIGEPLKRHAKAVMAVAWSPDGHRIASGSNGAAPAKGVPAELATPLLLWDADTLQPIGEPLAGHDGVVTSVAFSPDSRRVVSAGSDHTLRLWDTATGRQVGAPLAGHAGWVIGVAYSRDGERLASTSWDGTLRVWNADPVHSVGYRWQPDTTQPGPGYGPLLATRDDGRRIVKEDLSTGSIWIIDVEKRRYVGPLTSYPGGPVQAAISRDRHRVALVGPDNVITIWDSDTGQPVGQPLTGIGKSTTALAFSADGQLLAAASDEKTIQIFDIDTRQPVGRPLEGLGGASHEVVFSLDGHRIAAASDDKTVRIWNVDTAQPIGDPLAGHEADIRSIEFGPDRTRLVTRSADTVQIWDAATGARVGSATVPGSIWASAISPDGTYLVTAENDQLLRWDLDTGKQIGGPMTGHASMVASVAISNDSRYIVSGGWDRTLRFWDTATGQPVGEPLTGPDGWIVDVRISADGRVIRTTYVGYDQSGGIWVWPGPSSWAEALCRKLTFNMSRKQWSEWVSPDIEYTTVCPALPRHPDDN
ncbi:TIR domain-containing protein [Nocardia vinacea]|uniref:TIR domain-containing protein n=1 Tax=Nocardia vinacea TaxID=96468 RepID=UPI0033E0ADE9